MDPDIVGQWNRLLFDRDVDEALAWAAERSATTYVDRLNAASKPIYLSTNASDDLFEPNPALDYYERLTGPKRLDINRGEHAAPGLGFGRAGQLRLGQRPRLVRPLAQGRRERNHGPAAGHHRAQARGHARAAVRWPAHEVQDRVFYLHPRTLLSHGKLSDLPNASTSSPRIFSDVDTIATSGFPVLSSALEGEHLPVRILPDLVDRLHGFVYQSDALPQGLSLRGRVRLHVQTRSSSGKEGLVAYLYDMDPFHVGTLLTRGAVSVHDGVAGAEQPLDLELTALAHDLAPGHRLVLVVDTFDLMYAPPALSPYSVDFLHSSDAQDTLTVQVGG